MDNAPVKRCGRPWFHPDPDPIPHNSLSPGTLLEKYLRISFVNTRWLSAVPVAQSLAVRTSILNAFAFISTHQRKAVPLKNANLPFYRWIHAVFCYTWKSTVRLYISALSPPPPPPRRNGQAVEEYRRVLESPSADESERKYVLTRCGNLLRKMGRGNEVDQLQQACFPRGG